MIVLFFLKCILNIDYFIGYQSAIVNMDAIHKFSQQNLVESIGTENETNTGMLGTFLSGINKQVRVCEQVKR